MEAYRLFWVSTGRIRRGKRAEALNWWKERAQPNLLADPWTKSVQAFAVQFGLGGEYSIEIWQEIEDYAAFDAIDKKFSDDSEGARATFEVWEEGQELIKWGPSRLMGDWPHSQVG